MFVSLQSLSYQGSTILFCLQNKLPSWQLKEDGEYASSRTFDFHKFAENFKAQSSDKRWSSDSNGLEQDFTSAKSIGQPSLSCDSDSENNEDDEIFLVFRGKPNSRLSSFDECQAAAGKSNNPGADPGFFLGGGALVSCSTSTPITHIIFFSEYQLY